MLEICLVIFVIVLIVALCLHHYSLKKKLTKTTQLDRHIIRTSAEHSIMASNTVNPITALTEVTKAVQIIESLHNRYGEDMASELSQIDTRDMLDVLQNQKERIIQDVMKQTPNFLPPHPLNEQARLLPKIEIDGENDDEE
jgi:ABC-type bacteriocin/lantibiotic exporter with double-glycine peptidase domain